MIGAGIPTSNTPVVGLDRTIQPGWLNFFASLLQRTGGSVGVDVTVVKTVATGASTSAAAAQATANAALPKAGGTMTGPLVLQGATGAVNASSAPPVINGTAAPGTSNLYARGDHVHPTDTSRYAATNPANYQTASQVAATLASPPEIGSVVPASAAFTTMLASGGVGVFGHAAPTVQPATPVTLADVIAIIRGCGLSA